MAYWPEDQGLYISEPTVGLLQRYDFKRHQITNLLLKDQKVPRPKALAVYQKKLYVTDEISSVVYQVEPVRNSISTTVHLEKAGQGKDIEELAPSDKSLYALQSSRESLTEVLPQYRPISLATAWGFTLKNTSPYYQPFLMPSIDQPTGFAVSPRDSEKLFVSPSHPGLNSIISVKDYHFDSHWSARDKKNEYRELTDFDYPVQKPVKTFRILIVGNSRLVTAPAVPPDESPIALYQNLDEYDFRSSRVNTFPKQLEFLLNSEASLEDVPEHFEVLTLGRPGAKIQFFAPEEVPNLVKKYDIDLVIGLLCPAFEESFEDYYTKPLTEDGIPSNGVDTEFLLKPWRERIPEGAPKRLLDYCFKHQLVREVSPTRLRFKFFQDLLLKGDSDSRDDLVEMLGKPLEVLDEKLSATKTSSGKTPQFGLFFVPDPDCLFYSRYESFWSDVCSRYGLKFLDLSRPYEDLKVSYYPTTEACCHHHYTAYGNALIAYLLSHYLPRQGWIPFGPDK